jgi:hypothetical protein
MKIPRIIFGMLALAGAALAPRCAAAAKGLGWNADCLALELSQVQQLPALREGESELTFSEIFQKPVGPAGLEYTAKIRQLDGKRVRLLGFMVRRTRPSPGVIILSPYAMATHEGEYGLCDDLPPAVVFVEVPKYRDIAVPFTPGPLLLSGRLELSRREESDGRISYLRLILDLAGSADTTTLLTGR